MDLANYSQRWFTETYIAGKSSPVASLYDTKMVARLGPIRWYAGCAA